MIAIVLISIGILVCIILSGTFSASEMAYSSCNEVRIENAAEEGNKKAKRVLNIISNFDNALSAILIGNNLVNIASSSLTSVLVLLIAGNDTYTFVGTIIVTILVIIFGETIPKITAKKNSNQVALQNSGFIYCLMIVLKPFIAAVVFLTQLISKGVKEAKQVDDDEETVEELHSIINTAEDEGVLDSDTTQLVQAAIDFSDISAFEVMTARVDIQAINVEDSLEEIMEQVEDSPYSRFPVYEDSIDHIIGTIHLNHLFKAMAESEKVDIKALLLPPCFVYKTMKLPKVLSALKAAKQHLAIVTDEYSGTLGVISMEDVLEQIVGDIWDENDAVEPEVVQVDDSSYQVDGDMVIDDFRELLGLTEDQFDFDSETAGGFVTEYLERFPKEKDSFEIEGFRITVLEMDERRVVKLKVQKLPVNQE